MGDLIVKKFFLQNLNKFDTLVSMFRSSRCLYHGDVFDLSCFGTACGSIVFAKVAGDKGISETKSKQQNPSSICMHRPVTPWGKACSTCMHK